MLRYLIDIFKISCSTRDHILLDCASMEKFTQTPYPWGPDVAPSFKLNACVSFV